MPIGDLPPHPLEVSQCLKIIRAIKGKSRLAARDRAILTVLWRCGIRNSELRNCRLDHVCLEGDQPYLRVMQPKGRENGVKPRNVGLDAATLKELTAWLEWRGVDPGLLFPSLAGMDQPISLNNLGRMVRHRARRARVMRRVHPHCFRHTYAKDLLDEGANMVVIQRLLGHSSLQTTAQYLGHIGCDETVELSCAREMTI